MNVEQNDEKMLKVDALGVKNRTQDEISVQLAGGKLAEARNIALDGCHHLPVVAYSRHAFL